MKSDFPKSKNKKWLEGWQGVLKRKALPAVNKDYSWDVLVRNSHPFPESSVLVSAALFSIFTNPLRFAVCCLPCFSCWLHPLFSQISTFCHPPWLSQDIFGDSYLHCYSILFCVQMYLLSESWVLASEMKTERNLFSHILKQSTNTPSSVAYKHMLKSPSS